MTHLKKAFDEEFEQLNRSPIKVKQAVLNAIQEEHPLQKRRMPRVVTVLVAIFVLALAGVLARQFVNPQIQAAGLDDSYYKMLVYENYNLSNFFLTEKATKAMTYNHYIQNVALIKYAEHFDLEIYKEQVEKYAQSNKETIDEILEEQPTSWMHYHLQKIEQQFSIDYDQYLELQKEFVFKPLVAKEMLLGYLHDELSQEDKYDEVNKMALTFYEETYSKELAAFRDKYDINTEIDYTEDRKGPKSVLTLDGQQYDTVEIDGKEVFKNTSAVLDTFMFQFEHVRTEIEKREGLTLFCYETLDDYYKGAEKLLNDKEYGIEAMRFMELIPVLKNSVEID